MEFQTNVIKPIECFREGWELIKNQYWLFFGITIIGILIGSFVPFGIVLGAMMCGIYYCLLAQMDNRKVEFGDLFKGFDHLLPSLIVVLVVIVPTLFLTIGLQIGQFILFAQIQQTAKHGGDVWPLFWTYFSVFGVVGLVFGLLMSCLHALIMFAFPLIVERKLSGVEAFKLSARAVLANLSGVVGLILLEFVAGLLGVLACYVGALFVMPVCYAAVAVAYRRVFPANNQPRGDNLNYPPPPPRFVNPI